MLIHAKAYDRWTRRLVQAVKARGAALAVRAEGPYADAPAWTQRAGDDGAVIAAGAARGVVGLRHLFSEPALHRPFLRHRPCGARRRAEPGALQAVGW